MKINESKQEKYRQDCVDYLTGCGLNSEELGGTLAEAAAMLGGAGLSAENLKNTQFNKPIPQQLELAYQAILVKQNWIIIELLNRLVSKKN